MSSQSQGLFVVYKRGDDPQKQTGKLLLYIMRVIDIMRQQKGELFYVRGTIPGKGRDSSLKGKDR